MRGWNFETSQKNMHRQTEILICIVIILKARLVYLDRAFICYVSEVRNVYKLLFLISKIL